MIEDLIFVLLVGVAMFSGLYDMFSIIMAEALDDGRKYVKIYKQKLGGVGASVGKMFWITIALVLFAYGFYDVSCGVLIFCTALWLTSGAHYVRTAQLANACELMLVVEKSRGAAVLTTASDYVVPATVQFSYTVEARNADK